MRFTPSFRKGGGDFAAMVLRAKNIFVVPFLFLFCINIAHAQKSSTEFHLDFRTSSSYIDPNFSDNASELQRLEEFLDIAQRNSEIELLEVEFCGLSSPEGSYEFNSKVAQRRRDALVEWVRSRIEIDDNIISYNDDYIAWDNLIRSVEESDMPHKRLIIEILSQEPRIVAYYGNLNIDHRILKIIALDRGKTWRQLLREYFAEMRYASLSVAMRIPKLEPLVAEAPSTNLMFGVGAPVATSLQLPYAEQEAITPVVESESQGEATEEASKKRRDRSVEKRKREPLFESVAGRWHLKTSLLSWEFLMANIAADVDIAEHVSFTLPIYYSALNYFTSTIKFRTFAFQPEIRYWLKRENNGFFAGAHFGYASYNIALNGDYRYQDHNGTSPLLGGGISVGYRIPLSKHNRWNIEFVIGAGAYRMHYDKFYNTPNPKDGMLVESVKRTYWGIDNVAINISYRFDLIKRKR